MSRTSFPVSVVKSHNSQTHVQKIRCIPGKPIGTGEIYLGKTIESSEIRVGEKEKQALQSIAALWREGFQYLNSLVLNGAVNDLFKAVRKKNKTMTVAWMRKHDVLLDVLLDEDEPIVRLDTSWLKAFDDSDSGEQTEKGLTVLAAMAQLHLLTTLNGLKQRESIHILLDSAALLPREDLDALHAVLRGRHIDANNTFSLMLAGVEDDAMALELDELELKPLCGVPTRVLFEVGNRLEHDLFTLRREGAEASLNIAKCLKACIGADNGIPITKKEINTLLERIESSDRPVSLIEKTLKWRDKWVSWLLGQWRVNIPYDQSRVVRLMAEEIEDVDEKRALINEAISSTYDLEIEGENIQQITTWARNSGMRMVAGRLSRAFGNQAHLLSVAKVLADKQGLLPYVKKLHKASMGLPALQTQATRLLHLVQQRKSTPFAQTVGALNHFEEALFAYQSKEFKRMLTEKDEASRRVIGRPDAETCGDVLDTIQDRIRQLYQVAAEFRDELERTKKNPAAYIVFLQRLHPAETVNLANANLLREVHPGKEEDLEDLTRQGGHYTYSSPGLGRINRDGAIEDTNWIIQVDDWIEAIPLFIHERVVRRTIDLGGEESTVEMIETEVDQEAMEVFFRLHSEFWAQNIEAVMDSEHIGLSRRLLVQNDAKLSAAAEAFRRQNPDRTSDEAATVVIADNPGLYDGVTALAALISEAYRQQVEKVNLAIEKNDTPRIQALESVLFDAPKSTLNQLLDKKSAAVIANDAMHRIKGGFRAIFDRLRPLADPPTRPVSSLHILTTESAGMTEGYVQTWIEEEMALFNVIRDQGLEVEVNELMDRFRTRMLAISKKVIDEFGMGVVIDEVMAQQRLPEPAAVMTVLMSFKPVMEEAAKLAVLIERAEAGKKRKVKFDNADDPKDVDDYIKRNRTKLLRFAVPKVAENNGKAFDKRLQEITASNKKASLYELQKKAIASEDDFKEELEAIVRFEARQHILERLDKQHPELHLFEQARTYIRMHTALGKSTARKRIIAKHKLNALTMHPLNYYQAAGGNKRYNLLYTPSRVNLGEHERDSVVKWSQWVGGADRWAAQAGSEFYSQINEGGVEERPALAYAEIQKTSENALCVTHFAGSNALALLCMAVLEGDAEDMADQMNLRHDRMVPPAGEGYGGYCVPKDGLFLAFVLSLQNEVKLRQIGIPERYHDGMMKLAKDVLLRQNDFESHFDWQRWAAEKLLTFRALKKYFDIQDDLLVFQITKIARAVENLGQPWYETADGSKLVANLAANWGVEKMIIRAEQVNRFMVFYKAWMIYDALREARLDNPNCPAEEDAVIALSAEYKPVQDVRFSTGMRLFEILAQTGDHLFHSLDREGQNLAQLMFHGFDPDTDDPLSKRAVHQVFQTLRIDKDSRETLDRLKEAFPPHKAPGDLIMTSVTMSSTQDLLYYTSDTKLEEIAMQVQVILNDYGLTEDQIRANATAYGGRLRQWAGINTLPVKEQDELVESIGGRIHALVLQMRGPGRGYEQDIQGVDVLNTGIPFPELLDMLDNMPMVVSMMRNGKPNSALAIADGAAGRARRALTYFDVQLFFAACEKIGRRGVYRAIGLGKRNIDRLREEMHRKRERAEHLCAAVVAIANAKSKKEKEKAASAALEYYRTLREEITVADEAGKALREEEKMKRYNKWKKRDYFISQALTKIGAGLPLQRMDFGTWIAGIGGVFVITGESKDDIHKNRCHPWSEGIKFLAEYAPTGEASEVQPFGGSELKDLCKNLIRPEFVHESQRFAQQMLVESSSKAVEIAAREALERRKALKVRAERAKAFNDREDGFRKAFNEESIPPFGTIWEESRSCLEKIESGLKTIYALKGGERKWPELQSQVNHAFGQFIGHTRSGLARLFMDYLPESDANERAMKRQALDDLAVLYTGREIIFENLKKIMGGYEDIGAIARLAEAAEDDWETLEIIAKGIELFYITFALAQTLEFALVPRDDVDPSLFWKNIVDFFAETINDHWYEYWPWAYSRGIGFNAMSSVTKFELSVERHEWLYGCLRELFVNRTELYEWSVDDRDALLGNFTGDKRVQAIGANAPTDDQRSWRAYNQLRELAFVKSDGFEFPPVFHEFDPDIIEADKRINTVFLFPIGRTHVSRALREGPVLNREMQAKKHPGTNIIITRYNDFIDVKGAKKKALLVEDGHFYISEAEYAEALKQCSKLNKTQVRAQIKEAKVTGRLTDKGIRIAARFACNGAPSPIVAGCLIPFHGLPIFISGESEAEGMPATINSQFYGDLTYDKSLYPSVYTEASGVQLPPEIDWLNEWNEKLSPDQILKKIKDGIPKKKFMGIREFAKDHPIILVKGAAESGARNLKVFDVQDESARIVEDALNDAARFIFDVSRGQNVVIQAAVFTNPELWASPEYMEDFVERQVLEWNTPVNRDTYPRSQIYGSLRIVASSSHPSKKYDTAFPITLMSLQVATNVGRGGILDTFKEEFIQPQFRKQIMKGLHAEGPKVMKAMNAYVEKHGKKWEKRTGHKIGKDLRGVSYGWANYLMSDYVIMPIFKRRGRLADIKPVFDEAGRRIGSVPILQDEKGRFEGEIVKWQFIHLEPNVGIGLWDRYNLREEWHELKRSQDQGVKFDWNHIGQSDRIILRNYVLSGEDYLKANFKKGIDREAVEKAFSSRSES